MLDYFVNFIISFVGINNNIAVVIASILSVTMTIAIMYLLTKIVFPRDTFIKNSVFLVIWIASILVVLISYDINPITIMQVSSEMGVSA